MERKNCIHQFSVKYIQDIRSQCFQLSRQELDILLFGQLLANADKTEITCTEWRHSPHVRSRMSCSYRHQGKSICLRTLLFIHTTGIKRFKTSPAASKWMVFSHVFMAIQSIYHGTAFLLVLFGIDFVPGKLHGRKWLTSSWSHSWLYQY